MRHTVVAILESQVEALPGRELDHRRRELDVLGHDGHGFGGHERARRKGGDQRDGEGTPEVTVCRHGRRPRYVVGVARYNRER